MTGPPDRRPIDHLLTPGPPPDPSTTGANRLFPLLLLHYCSSPQSRSASGRPSSPPSASVVTGWRRPTDPSSSLIAQVRHRWRSHNALPFDRRRSNPHPVVPFHPPFHR